MQSRTRDFIFFPNFDFATDSLFVSGSQNGSPPFPPVTGYFMLLDGTFFLLLDGGNLLLL